MAFRKIQAGLVQGSVDNFIGKKGTIFYDNEDGSLRISDGSTPGGSVIDAGGGGYTLPTASTTTKGGVKVDGTTITINNQIISAVQQDLSSYATETFVTTRGYLTSVGTISYNDLSNKPTLFSGSYTDLTDKPTIPSLTGYATETFVTTRGYLTTVGTISYADLSNKPTIPADISELTDTTNLLSAGGVSSYNDLTDKPIIPAAYTFNVAADDSTLRTISSEETIKFVGAGGITTASDAEGTITITQGVAAAGTLTGSTLASGVTASSLTSVGTLDGLTVSKSASGIALSISAEPYTPVGTQTWTFRTATGLGIPYSSWINFPDGTNQTTAWTGTVAYSSVTGTPTLATVATSGSYADLSNKPTIPTTVTVNGTAITLGSSGTVTADASTLTGTELKSTVVTSSLTSVGTLTGLTSSGVVSITNNTNSSSVTTGALKVSGGAGISGNVFVGGTLTSGGSLDVTGSITASANITASNLLANATNAAIFNTTATTVGIGGVATTLNLGASTGTATINNPTVLGHSANTTVNLWNTVATTVNFAGAATSLNIGASSGTTTVNNNLSMASGKTIGTTGTITSNHTTAFIAGDNAASNIALQLPNEAAIRNLTNGATNMYFDVSIGGSTQGQFQFRSSSSYTNILTMSSTGVSFSTDATFTSRTPSISRTAFNSAIDTEITLDSMRFRISNQGGIFPQVIGNGSSRNLAWTGVGAISGTAVTQVGSTGTIVASNAWTTLYNSHGMDAAGDTVTVTLQDKAAGRIYRITFVRSDNGSTTGYNIIGERIL